MYYLVTAIIVIIALALGFGTALWVNNRYDD